MKKIFIVCNNEFVKFLSSKKIWFIVVLLIGMSILGAIAYGDMKNDVIDNLPKAELYSDELKIMLLNLSGLNFTRLFLTDIIYKPYFSIYLVFIVLIAVDIFAIDEESGNMKFTLLTGLKLSELIIGKFVFILFISCIFAFSNFIISFSIGQLYFGGVIYLKDFFSIVILTILAVFPAISISGIVFLFSQSGINSKVILGCSILMLLILGLADTYTVSKMFSPIGAMSVFIEDVPKINIKFLICIGISIAYSMISILVGYATISKRDIFR